jgi:methionine sulfoxide reductase heme-binding subunit
MRIPTWTIVAGAAAVAVLLGVTWMTAAGGYGEEGAAAGARITARWSFVWFLAAWSASSLAKLWPGGWRATLLRRRRAVGLAFAANHFVHLGFVLTAVLGFGLERSAATLVGGGAAYLLVAAMAATSNDAARRWMGLGHWRLLHAVGGWVVLLIFTNSYAGRLMTKPELAAPALALIATALILRAAAVLKGRLAPQAA